MGREQVVHAVAGQRMEDEEMRGRRRALRGGVLDRLRGGGDLRQRRRKRVGPPGGAGAEFVGAYSRVRLIAICTIMAAIGARITIASVPTTPSPLLLSRWPPKNSPNCASMEMAPAMVAVMVIVSVSRFLTWASSWAITPTISSRESICR